MKKYTIQFCEDNKCKVLISNRKVRRMLKIIRLKKIEEQKNKNK
jgi:hypothetical protein